MSQTSFRRTTSFSSPHHHSPRLPPKAVCLVGSAPAHSSVSGGPPIAVCLVGSARAFEATGPSLLRHLLLPSAHPSPQHLSHCSSHLSHRSSHLSHRPLHLFLHAPLDETAAKLSFLRSFVRSTSSGIWGSSISWNSGLKRKPRGNDVAARDWPQLARENAIASVRVFPNSDVDETKYPTGVMFTGDSPSGLQGLLQYFRLVEGCWDMIQSFEATSAPPLRYNWIVRARLDSLWTAPAPIQPPPPILPPSVPAIATTAAAPAGAAVAAAEILDDIGVGDNLAYTIPYGSDWWGLNDRFGMGGRQASEAALKRLSALQLLARRKMRNLNSEGAFKAQLSLGGIKVQRASLPFCVLSQRTYTDGCAPTVYSLNSSVPLNGAKCRPCSRPCATGEKARALVSRIAPSEPNWPGPAAGEGEVGVCDAARGWEKGWEAEFDAVMGEDMAEGRRQVVREAMGSIDECVQAWDVVVREAIGSIDEYVKACDEGPSVPSLPSLRRGDRWSPLYGRESAPHSPGPAAPPPQTCLRRDRGQDPASDHYRHDLRHSAGLAGRQNLPSEDAGGTARDAPNPSDVQATLSPSSPEIAAETVARGIALGVSAGLPDHEETGGEENEDAQGIADRPHPADEPHDAQEMGAEERAAAEADAEASARAPAAADRSGGSTQHAQGPTNTPARWGAGQAVGEESAPGRSGGRARLRRGAQGHAGEDRQAQVPATRSSRIPRAPDPVSRMDPSPPTAPQPTPSRRLNEDEVDVAPQAGRVGAAEGRGTRGIRVGRGSSRRGRRGNGRGRRGGGARGTNRRRTGASGYARTGGRLIREGVEGGEEEHSEEAEDEAENEESEGGDPVFNPEREGMLEAEAEDEEELETLLREAEFPNHQARDEPATRTTGRNRTAGGNRARGGN
ncbi:unnamed protein product [Closterium sp. NIES-64]|nr:unnamed protein product [Closterium sp. NIES-64]